jgi:hypothetical protein
VPNIGGNDACGCHQGIGRNIKGCGKLPTTRF